MQPSYKVRRMYVERTNEYEAGERVQGRLGSIVEQQNLSMKNLFLSVFLTPELSLNCFLDVNQSELYLHLQ